MTHVEALDDLLREIDAIQSRPFRRFFKPRAAVPARSTVSIWLDQFVALLVVRT